MNLRENNRILKIIAILIAVVLWFYVGVEQDPLERHTYDVPVEVENLTADKAAALSKETVSVTVMGRQSRLATIRAENFSATVDLSEAEVGEMTAAVHVTLPSEVYFAKIDPPTVGVMVTAREGESMDVEVVRTGMLPDGITIEEMSVTPARVFVSGDNEALSRVARAGVAVDMSKLVKDSKQEVPITFYDYEGNVIVDNNLQASPSKVTVSVKVSAVDVEKNVPIQANLVGSLPQGMSVESVVVTPDVATVAGKPEKLMDVQAVKTEAIDLSQLSGTATLSVNLIGKDIVSARTVQVTIQVVEIGDEEDTARSYTKVVPLAVTGAAADSASPDTQMVEVTYHMQPGYEDAGAALTAYVSVDTVPPEGVAATVQIGYVEGLVVDAITPGSVTIYSNY